MRGKFNPWILWDRFQCLCGTWWGTYSEYMACMKSHL